MTITLESLERAARRALEEDDTVPATRRDLESPPHLFLLEHELAADAATRDAQVRVRLDALRDRVSGPYVVNGRSVRARPMFHRPENGIMPHVAKIGEDAGLSPSRIQHLRYGQGLPADLVRLTQALLDAGRLPPGDGDLGARIRQLQWECGIGFDQAGYAREALRVVIGRDPGFYGPGLETFQDLDTKRKDRWDPIALDDVRAGDLVLLEEQLAVVYRVETVEADRLDRYRARGALLPARRHRIFEVDGSFDEGVEGGFRRDTWLFDPSERSWGSWASSNGQFVIERDGPFGERFTAAFRVRCQDTHVVPKPRAAIARR